MSRNLLKIELKDVRAIKSANIAIDGITVIAGENGCGKSSIARITYSIIKTSVYFDGMVKTPINNFAIGFKHKLNLIADELSRYNTSDKLKSVKSTTKQLLSEIIEFDQCFDQLINVIDYLFNYFIKNIDENGNEFKERLQRFHQILQFQHINADLEMEVEINQKFENLKNHIREIQKSFESDKEDRPIEIMNQALYWIFNDIEFFGSYNVFEFNVPIIDNKLRKISKLIALEKILYIDTPAITGLSVYTKWNHWEDLNAMISSKNGISNGNGKFSKKFDEILNGNVYSTENELENIDFKFKRKDGKEFDLLEVATGVKAFSILQLLYKNGFLNDKTLLIIDEPEAHLHPQWVVEYARLIVLLNKHLGVKFLIASHHPEMVSGIKYIAEKEEVDDNLNFYLAEKYKDTFQYNYKHLKTDIEPIFESFNIAFNRLDKYGNT